MRQIVRASPTIHNVLPVIEGKTFFVGDLHAHHTQLMAQLEEMAFDKSVDRLVCTGDLIDRGPEPVECLSLLLQPWFHSVLGNHDLMFVKARDDMAIYDLHQKLGGEWSTNYSMDVLNLLRDLIVNQMPLVLTVNIDDRKIGVIHSEAKESWESTINIQSDEDIESAVWSFKQATQALNKKTIDSVVGVDAVVSGHLAAAKPIVGSNQVWIDSYARTNRLTILDSDEIFAAFSKKLKK
jgi:serine/threonine protein phosphatase 1